MNEYIVTAYFETVDPANRQISFSSVSFRRAGGTRADVISPIIQQLQGNGGCFGDDTCRVWLPFHRLYQVECKYIGGCA